MTAVPRPEFCTCCTPTAARAPLEINNRPGLDAISYRIGTFATFRQTMLNSISRQAALTGLTTRESDDFAITVLELFAAVGDVLTFYNERIANEIFLRTARERDSVLRLVRLINYQLNPGQAAIAFLAFTLNDGARTRIDAGLKVMSVPGQDERPQIFETVEEAVAHADINDLPAFAPPAPLNAFSTGTARIPLASPFPVPAIGERLVLFGLGRIEEKSATALESLDSGTYLSFAPAIQGASNWAGVTRLARIERRLRFFGHNAPARHNVYVPGVPGSQHPWPRWVNRQVTALFLGNEADYPLDGRHDDLKPGARLLIDVGGIWEPRLRTAVVTAVEDKPAAITVTSGIVGDATQYVVQEDTVTHVALRQTIRGRPCVAPLAGGRRTMFGRSGAGAILWMTAGAPGDDDRWTYLDKEHLGSEVTVVGDPPTSNRFDLLAMDADGTLVQRTWDGAVGFDFWTTHDSVQTPSGIARPGRVIASRPHGLVVGGRVWALALGTAGDLLMADVTPSTSQTLVSLGGDLASAPTAVTTDGASADIFARGRDRALWWLHWDGADFGEWQSLGGTLAAAPAAVSAHPGRIDVVGVDDAGHLIHWAYAAGEWSDRADLEGDVRDEPAIVRANITSVDVFARGADDELRHIRRQGPDWGDWASLGGALTSSPAVLRHAGAVNVYARGGDGSLAHRERNASGWLPWESLGSGIDQIHDRRTTRIFQIGADDIDPRAFDYPSAPGGNRVALRLPSDPAPGFELVKKGRRAILSAGGRRHLVRVTASMTAGSRPGERADHLLVDIAPPLPSGFTDCRFLGNVVRASHGETQPDETLGNGDATRPFQKFTLSRDPLTYVPSSTSIEGAAELTVRVDGEEWTPVPSLYGRQPDERIYTVRRLDSGQSVVTFGNGRLGARLPTGAMNVRARYRKGLGLEGRVAAGQLSIALERPVGLKSVTNPDAAEGGADPESRDDARLAAPATVRTLGRAVSLRDFGWVATTSGMVARAAVTWVWSRLERAVHVTVAGTGGSTLSPASMTVLHDAMTAARDPNRQLFLANLVRVPLVVRAKVLRDPAFEADVVLAAARKAIEDLFAFETMPLGHAVHASGIHAALQGVRGVIAVDLDEFQLKGHADLTPVERAVRSVSADPLQPHVRIYPARPTPSDPAQIDRYARAGFGGGPVPPVLAAEQAYIADPDLDISITSVEAL